MKTKNRQMSQSHETGSVRTETVFVRFALCILIGSPWSGMR